jgi:glycosyltransferase involved in cell wall biosynthesis
VTRTRILSVFFWFPPAFSGEAEWWLRFVPQLRSQEVDVEVLASGLGCPSPLPSLGGETPTERLRPFGPSRAITRGQWLRWNLDVSRTLVRHRRQFDVALFHGGAMHAIFPACLFGRVFGWKTVYKMTLYQEDDALSIRYGSRLGWLWIAVLRLAHGFISNSPILDRTLDAVGLTARPRACIPQGVDPTRFRPPTPAERQAARDRLGVSGTTPLVLYCGSVIERKGIDLLAEAWREVVLRHPEAVLLVVGPDHRSGLHTPEEVAFASEIAARAADPVFGGSIRLLGYREDVSAFYRAADLLVFPSRREGWPSVVSEAMASGLPCVLAAMDGLADVILQDGEHGLVVRSADPRAYAAAIGRLLADPALRGRMGAAARERVVTELDFQRTTERYARFLKAIAHSTLGSVELPAR